MSAAQLFSTLGWDVMPSKYMSAYAILGFWALALVMTVLALSGAAKSDDATKQKTFNYAVVFALAGLAFALFFAIRTVS
jgi:hypothetical protein